MFLWRCHENWALHSARQNGALVLGERTNSNNYKYISKLIKLMKQDVGKLWCFTRWSFLLSPLDWLPSSLTHLLGSLNLHWSLRMQFWGVIWCLDLTGSISSLAWIIEMSKWEWYTKQKEKIYRDDQPKHSCKPILRLGAHETRTRTLYMSQWPPWQGGSRLRPRACLW